MKYSISISISIFIFIFVFCISIPFLFKTKEHLNESTSGKKDTYEFVDTTPHIDTSDQNNKSIIKYYDNYTEYLKEKTNTSYDQYAGEENLIQKDSVSAYVRKHTPNPHYSSEDKKIEQHENLIDYFIKSFKTYS